MPNYFVVFTAHIDERKRPEGFPKEVYVKEQYNDCQSADHIKVIVNDRFIKLVTSAGLVVLKNPDEPLEENIFTFDKRVFVPWHMITHLYVDVEQLVMPPIPTPQDSLIPVDDPKPEMPKETVH